MSCGKLPAILSALTLLAACSSLGVQPLTPAQALASDANTCTAYGFKPNTDNFAQCMLLVDQQRVARDDEQRQQVRESLHRLGAAMIATSTPPVSRITTCHTSASAFGNYGNSTTTCF